MKKQQKRAGATRVLAKISRETLLWIGGAIFVLPFLWMVLGSFKTTAEITRIPITLLPEEWLINNFVEVIILLDVPRLFFNSCLIAVTATLGSLITSAMAGYAFAKLRFRGSNSAFYAIFITMIIPYFLTLIPSYLIVYRLGLINNYLAVILPGLANSFGVFMMRQFILGIPNDLLDAARIDGCSEFRIFWMIVLPLCWPALATLSIFSFMWNWQDFLWPLLVLPNKDMMTLEVGINYLQTVRSGVINYQYAMAGATIAIVPVLIVFLIMQNQIIKGVTVTGMKGGA